MKPGGVMVRASERQNVRRFNSSSCKIFLKKIVYEVLSIYELGFLDRYLHKTGFGKNDTNFC
jgi:hypothetical protein